MSFVPNFKDSIPGYTGHKQQKEVADGVDLQQQKEPRKQIPGKSYNLPQIYLFLTK